MDTFYHFPCIQKILYSSSYRTRCKQLVQIIKVIDFFWFYPQRNELTLHLFHIKTQNDYNVIFQYYSLRRRSQDNTSGDVIRTISLDAFLQDERVTFIKMDIEGAELEALQGAERVIRECKPKLAVSIYHKKEDIWEIPHLILTYCPDYRFYLTLLFFCVIYQGGYILAVKPDPVSVVIITCAKK